MTNSGPDGNNSDVECPTCGKDDFSSRRYTKIHHKCVHGESIAGVEKECRECGETYPARADEAEASKYCSMDCLHEALRDQVACVCEWCGDKFSEKRSRASKRRFCSAECRFDWQSDAFCGDSHPNWSRITTTCEHCGDSFERAPHRVERHETNFCSPECQTESDYRSGENHPEHVDRVTVECAWCGTDLDRKPSELSETGVEFCDYQCFGEWRSENIAGTDHHQYVERVTVDCLWCGAEVERKPSQVRDNGRHFCGHDCHGEWRSENFQGEGHPRWKGGGHPKYGPGWQSKRDKVRERDGFECQGCGLTESEHVEEHGTELHVHHIKPFRTFDSREEANKLSNLVTLCLSCHRKYEGIPLKPQLA